VSSKSASHTLPFHSVHPPVYRTPNAKASSEAKASWRRLGPQRPIPPAPCRSHKTQLMSPAVLTCTHSERCVIRQSLLDGALRYTLCRPTCLNCTAQIRLIRLAKFILPRRRFRVAFEPHSGRYDGTRTDCPTSVQLPLRGRAGNLASRTPEKV